MPRLPEARLASADIVRYSVSLAQTSLKAPRRISAYPDCRCKLQEQQLPIFKDHTLLLASFARKVCHCLHIIIP